MQETPEQHDERMDWWRHARFGMFIHWGLYAIPGRGEWAMNRENIPVAEYEKLADHFSPRYYDPRQWVRLAKEAGARYAVLTTKHHDGFCLWDSQLTDYTAVRSAARRDLVGEYVAACREGGLKVGFYFTLMDWHHPDGDGRGARDEGTRRRFIDYVHGQLSELLSNYGRIDVLWYDVPWPYDAAGWESHRLNAMARQLQPQILINDRAQLPEDFATSEQHIKSADSGRDWEACMTLNDNWGYHAGDHNWKSAREVIMMLADCAKGGGNLLLNVGPAADGQIPAVSQSILRQVGAWLERNGEAIYGTDRADVGWGMFGKMTAKGNTLYLLIDKWAGEEFTLGRLSCQATSARLLATGVPVQFMQEGPRLRIVGLPHHPPDAPVSVIAVEMDRPPKHSTGPSCLNPVHKWSDADVGLP